MECSGINITISSYCHLDSEMNVVVGVYDRAGPTDSGRSSFLKQNGSIVLEYDLDLKVRCLKKNETLVD